MEPTHQAGKDEVETFVTRFAELLEEGTVPEIQEYLASVPEEARDECRARIETLLDIRKMWGSSATRETADVANPSEQPQDNKDALAAPELPNLRIEKRIGQGALGDVYAAWDEILERTVAVKILRRDRVFAGHQTILDEARKAAKLRDPAIVTIYWVTEGGDVPAIVMEYVEGFPIDRAALALTWRQRARLLLKIVGALSTAHAQGIIHRDLKPENILVTPDLKPKVLDFGLAVSTESPAARTGVFAGTPLFASPEQARCEPASPASDMFSFGSVMFTVLTGRPPFEGKNTAEVLRNITCADPPFPRSISSRIPEDLQAICLACLSRDPEARPNAGEVAADLRRYLGGEPARLRPALYGDLLRQRASSHVEELRNWKQQGIVSGIEQDRLEAIYRRMLADEDHWIIDARRLSLPQAAIHTGTWVVVVSAMLLVWLCRDELSGLQRWLYPAAGLFCLFGLGIWNHLRGEILASASFLASAVMAAVPTALSIFVEWDVLIARPESIRQLLDPPFSNLQILVASACGLGSSLLCLGYLRLTAFAWTTAVLAVITYSSFLLTQGWLDQETETRALWCLPLIALEGPALLSERKRRFRWALPFHLIALMALVLSLDVMAKAGPTIKMLGLTEADPSESGLLRDQCFSFALNGLLFLAIMISLERAPSLDLRRGSRILEIIVPLHILGALYVNARRNGAELKDALLYMAAVLFVLALGPWRSRKRFLFGALIGLALGSHLLIDLDHVAAVPFTVGLGITGLALAVSTSVYLRRRGVVQGSGPKARTEL